MVVSEVLSTMRFIDFAVAAYGICAASTDGLSAHLWRHG
jgi:hypothetical protein